MAENPRSGARARTRLLSEYTLVELYGEIDLAALPEVTPPLERAAQEAATMVVDLRAVTFFDCSLLRLLCRSRARVLAGRGQFHLVCVKPRALRILRLTDLLGVFDPVSSPAELALGRARGMTAPVPATARGKERCRR